VNTVLAVVALLAGPVAVWAIARLVFRDKVRGATILAGSFAGRFAAAAVVGVVVWLLSRMLEGAPVAFKYLAVAFAAAGVGLEAMVLGRMGRDESGRAIGFERALSYTLVSLFLFAFAYVVYLCTTVPTQALFGQLLIGLINGSFYALLSLGLAVIFGLLNIINFTHGAQYMMGAFVAYFLLNKWGVGYWWSLALVPLVVGAFGVLVERLMLSRLYKLDHLYGLLLTFGLALIIEGMFRQEFGSSGQPYPIPKELEGGQNLGFMFLPNYRAWVIVSSLVICLATWFMIERTKLGAYLRAATENPALVQAFGINVPRMITLTYGFGVGLAALAGVFAAPIYQVAPQMGSSLIIVVFAVVVIGGMGSIMGSIITGFGLGIVEGLTKVFYPEASNTVIFVIMAIVLMIRPQGLFGQR
jgi:branched-chain amino acid transport system permease protein